VLRVLRKLEIIINLMMNDKLLDNRKFQKYLNRRNNIYIYIYIIKNKICAIVNDNAKKEVLIKY